MRATASASEAAVEEAATRVLKLGGTAGEALIAGFLCAAALRPSVLFAPLQALIAGPGVGARAFDGRSRQPGLGVPRPRGFITDQAVPMAAYLAAPGSIAALAVLHAHDPSLSFSRLAESGVEQAGALGASERRNVIKRVGQAGPSALREAALLRPVLAAGGRAEGGVLSEEDIIAVRPSSAAPRDLAISGERHALILPWPQPGELTRTAEVIVAVDSRGVLGALAYVPDDAGVQLPELGLTLPRDAVLVRRGVPRMTPGDALPCVAPIAMALSHTRPFMAIGVRSACALDEAQLGALWSDPSAPAGRLLRRAQECARGTSAYGVIRALVGDDAAKITASDD